MNASFIGLDWGTSSFRAYLAGSDGQVIESRSGPDGILTVAPGQFEDVLERHIAGWDKALPVIASGMITSKQGWIETGYCECPAGPDDIAAKLRHHETAAGRRIAFVPGLMCRSAGSAPDVMRGEETQIVGAGGNGLFVLPGTHSKWVRVRGGGIESFLTFMTGEVFAALKTHTILGRLMSADEHDAASFARGALSGLRKPELLLNVLFSTRTLGLFGEVEAAHLASYLSGLLIGAEIAGGRLAFPNSARVGILASEALATRYLDAFALAGLEAQAGEPHVAAVGQARIGQAAGLIA